MKPCSNRRNAIALLALDEVEGQEAEELRSHLQSCEGCRNYFREISAVTRKMADVEMTSDVETSEAFHRKVMSRLREQQSAGLWDVVKMVGRRIDWRVGLPVTAVWILFICAFYFHLAPFKVAPGSIPPRPAQIAAPDASANVAPTLGNYEMAANQSLQTFDELLNLEATKATSGARDYTVSELTMADGAE